MKPLSTYDFYYNKKEGSKVPRRGNVPKREVLPDPMYGSVLVTKLVNSVMLDGKKGVAQKVVYAAFDLNACSFPQRRRLRAAQQRQQNPVPEATALGHRLRQCSR